MKYEDILHYLRTYSTSGPYDPNGLLHLILAAVDNLRQHAIDQDFDDYAETISDDQAMVLTRLLEARGKGTTDHGQ